MRVEAGQQGNAFDIPVPDGWSIAVDAAGKWIHLAHSKSNASVHFVTDGEYLGYTAKVRRSHGGVRHWKTCNALTELAHMARGLAPQCPKCGSYDKVLHTMTLPGGAYEEMCEPCHDRLEAKALLDAKGD